MLQALLHTKRDFGPCKAAAAPLVARPALTPALRLLAGGLIAQREVPERALRFLAHSEKGN